MSNVIIDHITLEGPTPKLAWVQYVCSEAHAGL